MAWKFEGEAPIYLQLAGEMRRKIVAGEYGLGGSLPSVRFLSAQAKINPNTVQKALWALEEEGLVYTKGTAGRFTTTDETVLLAAKNKLALDMAKTHLKEMNQLGYDKESIIALIQDAQLEMEG